MSQDLGEIKNYAHKNDVPIMLDGGMEFICNYIKEHNVKNILEIGTAIGYSSIRFASLAPDIYVTTLEIDIDRHIQAKQNIHDTGLDERITAIQTDALQYECNQKFDLIFIDAAKAQYINFFNKYKYNLAQEGVIVSDNLSFHGMVEDHSLTHNYSTIKLVTKIKKYIDFLKYNDEFNTTFYQVGDGVSVSKKKAELTQYSINVFNDTPYAMPNITVCDTNAAILTAEEKAFIAKANGTLETAFLNRSKDKPYVEAYNNKGELILAPKAILAASYLIYHNGIHSLDRIIFDSPWGELSVGYQWAVYELKLTEEAYKLLPQEHKATELEQYTEGKRIFIKARGAIYSKNISYC